MDEQNMDERQPPAGYRHLRLSDFGAFQPDITLLETLKTSAFFANQETASHHGKIWQESTDLVEMATARLAALPQVSEIQHGQKRRKKNLSLLLRYCFVRSSEQ